MKLKTLVAVCAVIFSAVLLNNAALVQEETSQDSLGTPIVIDVGVLAGKVSVAMNGQSVTIQNLGERLAALQKSTGENDPIFVRVDSKATVGLVSELKQLLRKTHKNVRIVLDESGPQELTFSEPSVNLQDWLEKLPPRSKSSK